MSNRVATIDADELDVTEHRDVLQIPPRTVRRVKRTISRRGRRIAKTEIRRSTQEG